MSDLKPCNETRALPIFHPITMGEVRMRVGEGKLTAAQMLGACNSVLRGRSEERLLTQLDEFQKAVEAITPDKVLRESMRKLVVEWREQEKRNEDSFKRTGSGTCGILSDLYGKIASQLESILTQHPEVKP